ncbi:MAG TPA: phosphatase PAP2 family protein [Thermoplasmatales archaeon]|nr:phosphatase PAP2 family protein [Thermoplasmatales archaeon]
MKKVNKIALMFVLSLSLFIVLSVSVLYDSALSQLDTTVSNFMKDIENSSLTNTMILLTRLGEWYGIVFISALTVLALMYGKRKRDALIFSLFLIVGFLLESIAKIATQRERPPYGIIHVSGYSFPSGHAMMTALLFLLICYLYRKRLLYIISIFIVSLVGISRIYLNVHWLSDVIAGYALAICMFSIFIIWRYLEQTKLPL